MENIVIYHKNCNDGFTSAWIASKKLNPERTIFWSAQHGDAPPVVTGKNVYIIDFSYSRTITLHMRTQAKNFVLLDHHITAYSHLRDIPGCYFDMNLSGAGLAWKHFFPEQEMPTLVRLIQDIDLFRHEIKESRHFDAYVGLFEHSFENWDKLSTFSLEDFNRLGQPLLEYRQRNVDFLAKTARIKTFMGYSVPIVNCSDHKIKSELGAKLAEGYPFAIVWTPNSKGGLVCSLRSAKDGADVSKIAEALGGGGHAHAAAFKIDIQNVLDWFTP